MRCRVALVMQSFDMEICDLYQELLHSAAKKVPRRPLDAGMGARAWLELAAVTWGHLLLWSGGSPELLVVWAPRAASHPVQ